jgi:hypothetical protein
MRPGPTRQWPMGGGDEVISLSPGVLDKPMRQVQGRPGRTQRTEAQVPRRLICRCDALLSCTLETRAYAAVHRSRIMNSRLTRCVSCISGRNQAFPLPIERTLVVRIRGDKRTAENGPSKPQPKKKLIFLLQCIAGLHIIYF